MPIFISDSSPQQPAFIYAAYPSAASVLASSSAAGYLPADVLQADESAGWKPAATTDQQLVISNDTTIDSIALCGEAMAGTTLEVWGGLVADTPTVQLLDSTAIGDDRTAWFKLSAASSLPFIFYKFSGHSTAFEIVHIAAMVLALCPYQKDGVCRSPIQAEGAHLISHAGLYLGSVTNRVMRPFKFDPGSITPVEEVVFSNLMQACLRRSQGVFFIPDTAAPTVHFGWVDKKYLYEPKMKNSLYSIPAIPFTSRAA